MADHVNIRKATIHDLGELLRFEQSVINTERPFDRTLQEGYINYYDIKEMIADPQVEILIAEYEKAIIASGYARIENAKPYLKHQKYAYLGFMYVRPEFRGMGVNKKILAALKQWTASQGITEMRLEVYFKNEIAIKAYEKSGFEKHMIEMRMSL